MKLLSVLLLFGLILIIGCAETVEQEPTVPTQPIVVEVPEPPRVETEVIPTISLVSVPKSVDDEDTIAVTWKIESTQPSIAKHTAIHYETESHAGSFSTEVGQYNSKYSHLTPEYSLGEFHAPEEFSTTFKVSRGSDNVYAENIYLRAHAFIKDKNYWSDEVVVKVLGIGCAYNKPPCEAEYDCIDNECVLKPGCAYNNPGCERGYRCRNNECILKGGGGGGGGY